MNLTKSEVAMIGMYVIATSGIVALAIALLGYLSYYGIYLLKRIVTR